MLLFLFSIQKIEVRKDERKRYLTMTLIQNDNEAEGLVFLSSLISLMFYSVYRFCIALFLSLFFISVFLPFCFFSFTHWIFGCQNSLFFRNIKADVSFCGRLVALTFFYWNKHRYWHFWIKKTLEFRLRLWTLKF